MRTTLLMLGVLVASFALGQETSNESPDGIFGAIVMEQLSKVGRELGLNDEEVLFLRRELGDIRQSSPNDFATATTTKYLRKIHVIICRNFQSEHSSRTWLHNSPDIKIQISRAPIATNHERAFAIVVHDVYNNRLELLDSKLSVRTEKDVFQLNRASPKETAADKHAQ
jgi:hypothetical protein